MKRTVPRPSAARPPSDNGSEGPASVYFAATDGVHGVELWKTDGTADGTVIVRDIAPGVEGSSPARLTRLGDRLWFSAADGPAATRAWSSDGTPDGTRIERHPAPPGGIASRFTAWGDAVGFVAGDGRGNERLWRRGAEGSIVLIGAPLEQRLR